MLEKEVKTETIACRLTRTEYKNLNKFIEKSKMSMAEVVRESIKLFIAVSEKLEIDLGFNLFVYQSFKKLEELNISLEKIVQGLKKKLNEGKSITQLIKEVKETNW